MRGNRRLCYTAMTRAIKFDNLHRVTDTYTEPEPDVYNPSDFIEPEEEFIVSYLIDDFDLLYDELKLWG